MSRPRLHDDGYLAFLRKQPCCCGCGRPEPSQAAHIRIGFFAMNKKPDDKFAVPLNVWCHLNGPENQHKNEKRFWGIRHMDPFAIAARLYATYGGTGGQPRRRRTTIKPRLPKDRRTKIQQRTKPWQTGRKMRTRKSSGSWKRGGSAD